jgi:hypothetical protein
MMQSTRPDSSPHLTVFNLQLQQFSTEPWQLLLVALNVLSATCPQVSAQVGSGDNVDLWSSGTWFIASWLQVEIIVLT